MPLQPSLLVVFSILVLLETIQAVEITNTTCSKTRKTGSFAGRLSFKAGQLSVPVEVRSNATFSNAFKATIDNSGKQISLFWGPTVSNDCSSDKWSLDSLQLIAPGQCEKGYLLKQANFLFDYESIRSKCSWTLEPKGEDVYATNVVTMVIQQENGVTMRIGSTVSIPAIVKVTVSSIPSSHEQSNVTIASSEIRGEDVVPYTETSTFSVSPAVIAGIGIAGLAIVSGIVSASVTLLWKRHKSKISDLEAPVHIKSLDTPHPSSEPFVIESKTIRSPSPARTLRAPSRTSSPIRRTPSPTRSYMTGPTIYTFDPLDVEVFDMPIPDNGPITSIPTRGRSQSGQPLRTFHFNSHQRSYT